MPLYLITSRRSALTLIVCLAVFTACGPATPPSPIATLIAPTFAAPTSPAPTSTRAPSATPIVPSPTFTSTSLPTPTPMPTLIPTASANLGTWITEPPMLDSRAAHAVVSTGSAIYALAGTGPNGPVLDVERFDGKSWIKESSLPGHGLNAPAAVVLDNRIYLIGGFNTTTNIPSSEVLIYDLSSKKWSFATPLPAPRGGHAAVVLDGKIHVLGGGNSQSTLALHSVYDPANNTWQDLAPLPRSEGSPAAVVADGKIYAIGGRSGLSDFGDVYIYDPASDTWANGAAIEPRGTAGAVLYCGGIYLFGGESQPLHQSLGDVFRLNIQTNVWESVSPMPTPRNFARAVLFQNSVYVVGGSPTAGSSHASAGSPLVERFNIDCP